MPRKKKKSEEIAVANLSVGQLPMDKWIAPMVIGDDKEESFASTSYRSSSRRGELFTGNAEDYLPNLSSTSTPFSTEGNFTDTRDAVRLCNKAYWAFPLLRNVVEVMGELANTKIVLKGGNKKTRDFLTAWMNKINLWQLKEQFFREWFRSANCFIYQFLGEFKDADIVKMNQVYGSVKKKIPVKYEILNPETITAQNDSGLNEPVYYKILSQFQVNQLRNSKTFEETSFFASLDAESKKAITAGKSANVKLNADRLSVLLYKCQGYERMGVPMAYGVLKDIETKLELKRIDLGVARAIDRAMLHIKVGETPSQYVSQGHNVNPNTVAAVQQAFMKESVARVLVTDYTVSGDWLIPEVDKILGAEKYAQIDKDINIGLNAVLFNEGEKFANTSVKVQIFIERLKEARNAFIYNFLQKEIIGVCKAINAKNYPQAVFEDLSLKDEISFLKIVVQLGQLGMLTPEEMFEAMDNGILPDTESSINSQRQFQALKKEGLYMPVMGSSTELQGQQIDVQRQTLEVTKDQNEKNFQIQKEANKAKVAGTVPPEKPPGQAGRPTGSTGKKRATVSSPVGKSANASFVPEKGYSLKRIQELNVSVGAIHTEVDKLLRKKYKIKTLDENQAQISSLIVAAIVSNEEESNWKDKITEYVETPKDISEAALPKILEIQEKHEVDEYTAALLRLAECDGPPR